MNDQIEVKAGARQGAPPLGDRFRRRNRRRLWVGGTAVLAIVVLAATAWWRLSLPTPVHYVSAPVSRGVVTRTVTATGTVNPILTIIVGSYVSGVIQSLSCDYNTVVTAGQVCAKVDPRP